MDEDEVEDCPLGCLAPSYIFSPPEAIEGAHRQRRRFWAELIARAEKAAADGPDQDADALELELLRPLNRVLNLFGMRPSARVRVRLIPLLLTVVARLGRDDSLISQTFRAVAQLVPRRCPRRDADRLNLAVDPEVFVQVFRRLWFVKRRVYVGPSDDVGRWMGECSERMSQYFARPDPEGACEYIWREYRPRICPKLHVRIGPAPSPAMFRAWSMMLRLLPVQAVPQEKLDELVLLWELQITQDEEWTQEILSFLCRLAEAEAWAPLAGRPPPAASVLPHRELIADRIVRVLKDDVLPYGAAFLAPCATFTDRATEVMVRLYCRDPDSGGPLLLKMLLALGECACERPAGSTFVLGLCDGMKRIARELLRRGGAPVFNDEELLPWDPRMAGRPASVVLPGATVPDDAAQVLSTSSRLCRSFAQLLLPFGLDLLISGHRMTGASVCASLCDLCPEVALPPLLERARSAADITTSSVGHMPSLYQRLLAAVLAHGSDGDRRWMLQRVEDLISPEHVEALPHALHCVAMISAVLPLDGDELETWGCGVWDRLLTLCEAVDWPEGWDQAAQHLLFALPEKRRDESLGRLQTLVLERVHEAGCDGKVKNQFLRLVTRLCRAGALAAPSWAAALCATLQERLMQLYEMSSPREAAGEENESDAARLWFAQCLSVTSQPLGPALLPLLDRQKEVIESFLFDNPKPQDWHVKAGGSLLKHTLRSLICSYPTDYGSRVPEGGSALVRQHGVLLCDHQHGAVRWHLPSKAELAAAAQMLSNWLCPLLERLKGRASWQDAEADAARLRYLAKGGYLLLREGLFGQSEGDWGLCYEETLSSPEHAEAARAAGLDPVALVDALCSVPLLREEGCSEKVGAHLVQAIDGLLYDKQVAKDEGFYQDAVVKFTRNVGLLYTNNRIPRPCAAYWSFWRLCSRDCWQVQLRLGTRSCKQEVRLVLRLLELGGTGLERTRELAVEAGQDGLHKMRDVSAGLQKCLQQLERTPRGSDAAMDVDGEALAKGALMNLYDSSVLCRIWRHWPTLLTLAKTLLRIGYDARAEIKDYVLRLFEATFSAERTGRYYRAVIACGDESEVRAAISELLGLVSPEVAGDETGAAAVRALSMLGQLCRGMPPDAEPPTDAMLFFVDGLTHPLASARYSARAELSQCLRRLKRAVPWTAGESYAQCTSTRTLPTPTKVYDYSGEPPAQSTALDGVFTLPLVKQILSYDERKDTNSQDAAAHDAAHFYTQSAQLWKGLFQILKGSLVVLADDALKESPDPEGHTCFGHLCPAKVSELLCGLLRALRHWNHAAERELLQRSWALVLREVELVLRDGRLRDLRDLDEALCCAAARHPHLGPLEEYCLSLLSRASGLRSEWRALELVGRGLMRGLDVIEPHIAFGRRVIQCIAGRSWSIEFDEVRGQLAAANVYLLRLLQRHPPEGDREMGELLQSLLADWPHGTHVVLRTAGACDRSLLLEPYVETFAGALREAVAADLAHDDEGELVRILSNATKMTPVAPALIALRGMQPLRLSRTRGRTALQYIASGLSTVAVSGLPAEADEVLRELLLMQLRSHVTAAAEEAVAHVCTYARLGPVPPQGATLLLRTAQKAAEAAPPDRRGAQLRAVAGAATGVALSRVAQADEATFDALRIVVDLAHSGGTDAVRRWASRGAERWRRAAVEQQVVWQQVLLPALNARGLTRRLMVTHAARSHDA
eukprot:TRINITY_DN39955_c0_g1_i2.p1 TRINITY_DN39955_c0_g1~~TRINITY_DN39955_c0_g1_i2.p1  ORF type:complete len:1729 (+),score=578.09 TRINITY_DN39955_c0_g1_i2:75-5189(+)